jgi:HEPN domain-containing protein
MPGREELKRIAMARLKEAEVLHQNGFYDGAKYLSGYVIEAALKARICRVLDGDYPEAGEISKVFLTHRYDVLIKLAGLQKIFDKEMVENERFRANWTLVSNWKETFRYMPIGTSSKSGVLKYLNALQDPQYGILKWIKSIW